MVHGTILDAENFIVVEQLTYQVDGVTIPYIYGMGDSRHEYKYVRTHNEFVAFINSLLESNSRLFIYTYNLTPLAIMLSDYFSLTNETIQRSLYLSFNIGNIKFRGISPLICDAKLSSFAGVSFRNAECLPDVNLKTVGYNWITNYLEKLLKSEIEFIEEIMSYNSVNPPLTRAGFTKRLLADSCLGGTYNTLRERYKNGDKSAFDKLNAYRKKCFGFKGKYNNFINEDHYKIVRDVARGGCISYNSEYKNKLLHGVGHRDICSSYIYQLFSKKFPMRRVDRYTNVSDIVSLTDGGRLWAMLRIHCIGVHSISKFKPLSIELGFNENDDCRTIELISDPDCVSYGLVDDKFIDWANHLCISCTLDEFVYFLRFYDIDDFEVVYADVYETDYLPEEYLKVIMDMFREKALAKKDNAPEWFLTFIKAGLNSSWGFCWSGFYNESLSMDLFHYNNFSATFADRTWSYMWGIAVTAYAREALYDAIEICGDKWIYSDTDSVFYIKDSEIEYKLDELNECILESLYRCPNSRLFCFEEGDSILGYWDEEPDLDYFIFYTTKQYIGYGGDKFKFAFSGVKNFDPDGWFKSCKCNIDTFFNNLVRVENKVIKVPLEYGYWCSNTYHKPGNIFIGKKNYEYPSGVCENKIQFIIEAFAPSV